MLTIPASVLKNIYNLLLVLIICFTFAYVIMGGMFLNTLFTYQYTRPALSVVFNSSGSDTDVYDSLTTIVNFPFNTLTQVQQLSFNISGNNAGLTNVSSDILNTIALRLNIVNRDPANNINISKFPGSPIASSDYNYYDLNIGTYFNATDNAFSLSNLQTPITHTGDYVLNATEYYILPEIGYINPATTVWETLYSRNGNPVLSPSNSPSPSSPSPITNLSINCLSFNLVNTPVISNIGKPAIFGMILVIIFGIIGFIYGFITIYNAAYILNENLVLKLIFIGFIPLAYFIFNILGLMFIFGIVKKSNISQMGVDIGTNYFLFQLIVGLFGIYMTLY